MNFRGNRLVTSPICGALLRDLACLLRPLLVSSMWKVANARCVKNKSHAVFFCIQPLVPGHSLAGWEWLPSNWYWLRATSYKLRRTAATQQLTTQLLLASNYSPTNYLQASDKWKSEVGGPWKQLWEYEGGESYTIYWLSFSLVHWTHQKIPIIKLLIFIYHF